MLPGPPSTNRQPQVEPRIRRLPAIRMNRALVNGPEGLRVFCGTPVAAACLVPFPYAFERYAARYFS
jgi:hypothetical protein